MLRCSSSVSVGVCVTWSVVKDDNDSRDGEASDDFGDRSIDRISLSCVRGDSGSWPTIGCWLQCGSDASSSM